MSRFCGECGKTVGEGATFCGGCGANLRAAKATPPVAAEKMTTSPKQAVANQEENQTNKSKNRTLLYAVAAIVAVLGLAICGAIYAAYRVSSKASQLTSKSNLETILKSVSSSPVGETDADDVTDTSLNDEKDVCTYAPAEDGMVTVTVGVQWQNGTFAMHALPRMSKQLINEDMRQPVTGIGDEAYILGVDKETEKQFQQVPKELRTFSSFTTGPLVFRKAM